MENANQYSKVKLISECFIKPKYKVEESYKPHYLIAGDPLLVSLLPYMQRGFLYSKPPTSFDIHSLLEKLKHSLSHALVYYYPLAGRLTTVMYEDDEHACSIYVDCNKGSGARFIHATSLGTASLDVVSSNLEVLPIIRSLFDVGEKGVVNHHGHTRALLSVQVTELTDGVFVGFSMNHYVADGTSLWHFINSLSEIFKSIDNVGENLAKISNVPILAPMLPEGCSPIRKLPYLDLDKSIVLDDVDPQLKVRMFHFSASSMARLKAKAINSCGGVRKISSFQALAALLWMSFNKARRASLEEMTTCFLPMDKRPRFDPPLSPDHFGDMVQSVTVTRTVGELLENGLGWTAMLIHKAINETVVPCLKTILEKPFNNSHSIRLDDLFASIQNPIMFAGSVKFDMYGPEFGLGKAVAVPIGAYYKDDGMVIGNQGREGAGSVCLEIRLLTPYMNSLESDEDFMSFVS